MKIRIVTQDVTEVETDALIVNLFEGVKTPGGATGAVDRALGGAISKLIERGEAKGKPGEITVVHVFGQIPAARVAILGLGEKRKFDVEVVRAGVGDAARSLRKAGAKRISTILHGAGIGGLDDSVAAQAIVEGAVLGLYTYRRSGKTQDDGEVQELVIVEGSRDKKAAVEAGAEAGAEAGRIIAEAVCLARDMANTPANLMTPTDMAKVAQKVAVDAGLKVEIFERHDMERLSMGALLGVAKGSAEPPKFIVLKYRGDPGNVTRVLGLVGKGVTFDTGGISLKPVGGMSAMKTDMSGGATVIAAMRAIGMLKPKINVTGLIPAAENMPSATAQKPGDIVTAANGKTIEVENTDAEGRLLLADALSYGRKQGLSPMIDVATLTGAIRNTFGSIRTGAFTNDQGTLDRVLEASKITGERMWQMPMDDDYKEQNRSDVADVKNTGGSIAGSITAALFLAEFAEATPWVHLDIAGTGRLDSTKGYSIKGSSGVPVRTLVQFVLDEA
ncbi:MAG: leucyl aminopeptidase, partial [Chloroflexi bacterium]|nr:leucyl aminopeptidase [Chloroflexota bacterium]